MNSTYVQTCRHPSNGRIASSIKEGRSVEKRLRITPLLAPHRIVAIQAHAFADIVLNYLVVVLAFAREASRQKIFYRTPL